MVLLCVLELKWAVTTAQHNEKHLSFYIPISLFSFNSIHSITLYTKSQINIQSKLI